MGRWKIRDDRLFLTGIEAWINEGDSVKELHLDYFFPGQKQVFAEWFTGEIRVPMGKELTHIHMGYESVYEKDLYIQIEKGVVTGRAEVENA